MNNDKRKERLLELKRKGKLSGVEIEEFAGLSKEFPETAKEPVEPVKPIQPIQPVKSSKPLKRVF